MEFDSDKGNEYSEVKTKLESAKEKSKRGIHLNKKEERELKKELKMVNISNSFFYCLLKFSPKNFTKKKNSKDDHIIGIEELEKRYQTSLVTGLTTGQSKERTERYGENVLTQENSNHFLLKFLSYTITPFSIFLMVASLLCLFAFGLDPSNFENVNFFLPIFLFFIFYFFRFLFFNFVF